MKGDSVPERRDAARVNRIVIASVVLLVASLCIAFVSKSQGPAVLTEVEPARSQNSGETVLTIDGKKKPGLHLASHTQALQGWAKEEDALERLQKKAEKRLKKDVKADDKIDSAQNAGIPNAEAATDAREGIPEDSIRAEAAAMGYSTVRAWREANEHPLDIPRHANKKTPAKVAPAKPKHQQQKLHRPENILGKIGHWVSAFFKTDDEQQLYGGIPEEEMNRLTSIRKEATEDLHRIREQDRKDAAELKPTLDDAVPAHPIAGFHGAMAMSGITDDSDSSIPRLPTSHSMALREGNFFLQQKQQQQQQQQLGATAGMLWKAEQLASSSRGPVSDLSVER